MQLLNIENDVINKGVKRLELGHQDSNAAIEYTQIYDFDSKKPLDYVTAIKAMKGNKKTYYMMLSQFRSIMLMKYVNQIGNAINYK